MTALRRLRRDKTKMPGVEFIPATRRVLDHPARDVSLLQGLKPDNSSSRTARLKSCPDTSCRRLRVFRFGLEVCVQGLKPDNFSYKTARLKSCPDTSCRRLRVFRFASEVCVQGLKPKFFGSQTARLKSCPDTPYPLSRTTFQSLRILRSINTFFSLTGDLA